MVCQEFFSLDVLVREDLSHYIVVVLIGFEALFFFLQKRKSLDFCEKDFSSRNQKRYYVLNLMNPS